MPSTQLYKYTLEIPLDGKGQGWGVTGEASVDDIQQARLEEGQGKVEVVSGEGILIAVTGGPANTTVFVEYLSPTKPTGA